MFDEKIILITVATNNSLLNTSYGNIYRKYKRHGQFDEWQVTEGYMEKLL